MCIKFFTGMDKPKYYVVWEGVSPGIYTSWTECRLQVKNYPSAKYKSFSTKEEAEAAFENGYTAYSASPKSETSARAAAAKIPEWALDTLAVDASCLGNPGTMEYRGVYVRTGQEIFRIGPFADGTNNVGEFLALVHALALLKKKGSGMTVCSDSRNAIAWVRAKQCKTELAHTDRNVPVFDLIVRAEKWLRENTYANRIVKWETREWGEVPADFGRK